MSDEDVTDKTEILARMAESYGTLRATLDRAGAEVLERPGTWGDWSLKDLVAHLTYWQTVATDRLQKFMTGRADEIHFFQDSTESFQGTSEIDEVNENVYRANKDRPLAEMLEQLDITYQALRTAAKSVPADVYPQDQQPSPLRGWVAGNSFAHYDEHRPDIDKAIQRQSAGNE
jgi:hypothetical protein